jgi:hypothetical protein
VQNWGVISIATLTLEVSSADSDTEELDLMTSQLRQELLQLDVDDVRLLREGPAPSGVKGLDLAAIGTLLVNMKLSSAALTRLVNVVRSWVGRPGNRAVKMSLAGDSIQVTGLSPADQHRLIEQWIEIHAPQ